MSAEGTPHKLMVEALHTRLHQLYPEATFSFGKKVTPMNLKPDVFVTHLTGESWAYEMVHGNSHADHLLKNHDKYTGAGVHDHWILWESLEPHSKSRQARPVNQGQFTSVSDMPKIYRLNAPHRALLSMQAGRERVIVAFTPNVIGPEELRPETELMKMLSVGVLIYRFSGWDGEAEYKGLVDFVPLAALQFDSTGLPILVQDAEQERLLEEVAVSVLTTGSSGLILSKVLEDLEKSLRNPEQLSLLTHQLLEAYLKSCPPEDLLEIHEAFQSGGMNNLPPFISKFSESDTAAAFENPEAMSELGSEMERALAYVEESSLPTALKNFVKLFLDSERVGEIAQMMVWQNSSSTLGELRNENTNRSD